MLNGKYIWLVGASEGIGAALAVQLAAMGAHLALSARNAGALQAIAATLQTAPLVLPLDVTDLNSIDHAWSRLRVEWPTLDMVIYNAGTYEPLGAQQFDLQKITRMLDVNFTGALRVLSHVLPDFLTRNTGHIALVGSVAGYRGLPRALGYGASKAAIIHFAENLKADLAQTNVEVQIINPGFVKTRLTDKNDFVMPCMISSEKAAHHIIAGLQSKRFEIHFPKRFSWLLKFLALLPASLYFALIKKINS